MMRGRRSLGRVGHTRRVQCEAVQSVSIHRDGRTGPRSNTLHGRLVPQQLLLVRLEMLLALLLRMLMLLWLLLLLLLLRGRISGLSRRC